MIYIGEDYGGFVRKKKLLKIIPRIHEDLAFSIVHPNGETLDLVATNKMQFLSWVRALNVILLSGKGVQW